MASTVIEVLTATFYNTDVTARVQSLLADPQYGTNETFSFAPSCRALDIDTLPDHVKPFIMTWRLKQGPYAGDQPGAVMTIRVAEWTPINIVFADANPNRDQNLQSPQDRRIVSASWWTEDVTSQCNKSQSSPWVLEQAGFASEDPAPGIKKVLSTTWAFPTGGSPNTVVFAPAFYIEGETVMLANPASSQLLQFERISMDYAVLKARVTSIKDSLPLDIMPSMNSLVSEMPPTTLLLFPRRNTLS
ncbi:MAG: hypothetical protein Q9218_004287 [Villophora microphyllina]